MPKYVTNFYIEQQLSEVYTIDMFKKCWEELVKTIYCETIILDVNNESYIFNVKEITLKDPPRTIERYYRVEFWDET